MTNTRLRTIFAGVLVTSSIVLGVASRAEEPVKIQVTGRYFAEPATVHITVAVEPNQQNRVLRVEADGDNFFRSADVTLAGENEPRYHTLWFKNLPAGDYVVRATLLSRKTEIAMAETPLIVMSGR